MVLYSLYKIAYVYFYIVVKVLLVQSAIVT